MWLGDLRFLPGSPFLTAVELRDLAFPDTGNAARLGLAPHVTLLTDATELDLQGLMAHLQRAQARVDQLVGLEAPAGPPPVLLVTGDEDSYTALRARVAVAFGRQLDQAPPAAGWSAEGLALGWWSQRYGSLRPVYTHEYVHALVYERLGLPTGRDWLSEGLAALVQAELHPELGLRDFAAALGPGPTGGWEGLLSGRPQQPDTYVYSAMVVEMLASPGWRDRFPRLLEALAASGSADLRPHLQSVLGVDEEGFVAAVQQHMAVGAGGG